MKLILFIFCVTFTSLCFSQDYLFLKNGTEIYGSVLYINKAKVYFEDADTGDRKWHKKIEKLIDNVNENTIEYKVRDIDGLSTYLSGELVSGRASYYITHKHVPGGHGYLSFYYIFKDGDRWSFEIRGIMGNINNYLPVTADDARGLLGIDDPTVDPFADSAEDLSGECHAYHSECIH